MATDPAEKGEIITDAFHEPSDGSDNSPMHATPANPSVSPHTTMPEVPLDLLCSLYCRTWHGYRCYRQGLFCSEWWRSYPFSDLRWIIRCILLHALHNQAAGVVGA